MEAVFSKLLSMSLTGGVMILAILPLRLLLKKAPRWSICLLWALVALRLVCPVTLESSLSLIPSQTTVSQQVMEFQSQPLPELAVPQQTNLSESIQTPEPVPEEAVSESGLVGLLSTLWLSGVLVMGIYALVSYCRLKRKIVTATVLERKVYQSEFVDAPFVMGILRPRIYLPYGLTQPHLDHILAHERAHIRRGDHFYKPFGYLVLCLHWFNPLVWLAYILLCRDIEVACDEKVIKEMDRAQRQSYSATLLRCSVHRKSIAACPLAFGQIGVKQRIKGVLSYKKPTVWIVLVALTVGLAAGVCFMTRQPEITQPEPQDPLQISMSAQDEMDTLLDTLLDQDDSYVLCDPYKCSLLNQEAYQKLLAYDDLALSYFVPKLRKADIHSYREYMMVWVCSQLTGLDFGGYTVNADWWKVPQMWIAEYDRRITPQTMTTRLSPGRYRLSGLFYDFDDPVASAASRDEYGLTYQVTMDSLVWVYNRSGRVYDPTHGFFDTVRQKMDWQWQSADATEELKKIDQTLTAGLEKLSEACPYLAEDPIMTQPRRYQLLNDWSCLVQCEDRVYLVRSNSGIYFSNLFYVAQLSPIA